MTRVAGANPRIWVDIFLDNADAVREALGEHRRRIEQLEQALDERGRRLPRALDRRGVGQPAAHARGGVRGPRRAAAAARPRARPPGRARRDHAGARRGADQHRGLRAPAHVARARRRATRARHGRGARRAARLRCSRRRATASSSRRWSTSEDRAGSARSSAHVAVPGDKSISHRAVLLGAVARRGEPDHRLRPLGRHRVGDRARCARSASRSTRTASTTSASAAAGCAGCSAPDEPIDCGNAGTMMRLLAGLLAGQEGALRAGRRRVAVAAADGARRGAAARRWARTSRRPTATRRSSIEGARAAARSTTSCRWRARR